jgi:hypothetical protein
LSVQQACIEVPSSIEIFGVLGDLGYLHCTPHTCSNANF